jgi:hypothetical protein
MNKIWISFNFYLLVVINIIAVQNPISQWMIAAIILDIVFFPIIKKLPNDKLYEIMGITWLQKKYKNNKVIMEMTKE